MRLTPILLLAMTAAPLSAQSVAQLSLGARRFVSVDSPVVALEHVRVVDGTGRRCGRTRPS